MINWNSLTLKSLGQKWGNRMPSQPLLFGVNQQDRFTEVSKSSIDRLIYLDSEFISVKYEEIENVAPLTEFTKVQGLRGQAGIGLFSSDIHAQETRKFQLSSFCMWQKIANDLCKYPHLNIKDFSNYQGTKIGWLQGDLSLGSWEEKSSKSDQLKKHEHFELYCGNFRVLC
jgi:hypothetical protein